MHSLISSRCTIPRNLIQISEVVLCNESCFEKCFFDFFFDSADVFIFLGATKVHSIISHDNRNPSFVVGQWLVWIVSQLWLALWRFFVFRYLGSLISFKLVF